MKEEQLNEFKISSLRSFGPQNISFTATVHSKNMLLTDEEIAAQVAQIDKVVLAAFIASNEQVISENEILASYSDRRKAAIAKKDKALSDEMAQSEESKKTLAKAQKLSDKANGGKK